MLTKIYIPIIDLGEMNIRGDIDYNSIRTFRYDQNTEMNRYGGNAYIDSLYSVDRRYADNFDARNVKDKIKHAQCECNFTDGDEIDMDNRRMRLFADSGKMCVFKIDIDPDTLTKDCESEMKFWLEDSLSLLTDKDLDNKTKIKHLPSKDIVVEINGVMYDLYDCKIFKIFKSKDGTKPFNFLILVKKITYWR